MHNETPKGECMKHHARTVGLLGVLFASVAAAQATTTLTINGRAVTLSTVTVGGKTYVSLDQLRTALNAPGGANQQVALEGCRNEWLFNGIWRMRVTGVTPIKDDGRGGWPGWGVTVEWRNGTSAVVNLSKTGIEKGTGLAFTNGDTWANSEGSAWVDAIFKDIVQGAANIYQYRFWLPDAGNKSAPLPTPDKLVITVDPNQLRNWPSLSAIRYATNNPSFRVNLRCSK